ncbi:FHA domain-containing protein [Alkalibacter mobilis]|uniref:FHA domain-containing protein n=1 Tax=Alkalibacter mobilis TaxID=2787712 RepID=UPI00189D3C75|nr:FHA domain-containing protein [Alkalibacter mobilis]MBF7095729.1 FHA domain-containing protein [Alkalibacter mobilis]
MFEILASFLKYVFIIIIYYFIYGIIRLIYLDISTTTHTGRSLSSKDPYLKLINRRESLNFKVEESYFLDSTKTIGRSNKNQIIIKDPFLSSEHAEFVFKNNYWYVFDLGSKNGVYVNNLKVEDIGQSLNDGDTIHLGQLDFIFVDQFDRSDR